MPILILIGPQHASLCDIENDNMKKETGEMNSINAVGLEQQRFELLRFTYTGIPWFRTALHKVLLVEFVAEEPQMWRLTWTRIITGF